MKRPIILTVAACCLLFASCNSSNPGITNGANEPLNTYTELINGQFGKQYEKKSIKMFNANGDLYFDSGLLSNITARCGNLDGYLKNSTKENEIPHNSGEANFEANGYQNVTSITKEVNVDGKWLVFKKYENLPEDFASYKYCFYIKGRLNNAASDSEIVVLTDNPDITFDDVYAPLLNQTAQNKSALVSHNAITPDDKWGITLIPDNVSKTEMTIKIEQFGGSFTGNLQTGQYFKIEKNINDTWQELKPNPLIDFAWEDAAYDIKTNDITELDVKWNWLYGELSPGYYRLCKKVVDFRKTNDYDEEIYYVYFNID